MEEIKNIELGTNNTTNYITNNTTIINSTHEPELFDFYDMRIKLDIFEKERRIIIE